MTSYIGIDVGKKSIHMYLLITDKSLELNNKHYQSLSVIVIVFEPTGGYERNLREFLNLLKLTSYCTL